MSAFILKLIAVICMSIDHIGAVFPKSTPMFFRYIGRMAFPIYLYFIAEGCLRTKNINKYTSRIFIFALISEIPFDLAFNNRDSVLVFKFSQIKIDFLSGTNVFYTLFLGILCINIYEKLKTKTKKILLLICIFMSVPICILLYLNINTLLCLTIYLSMISLFVFKTNKINFFGLDFKFLGSKESDVRKSEFILSVLPSDFFYNGISLIIVMPIIYFGSILKTDYGMFGIIMIIILYLSKTKKQRILNLFLGFLYFYGNNIFTFDFGFDMVKVYCLIFASISIVTIDFYNGEKGKNLKWFFYVFYPLHLLILFGLRILI